MHGIQVDNQLPLSPMHVLFRPQRMGIEADYILKFSMTQKSDGSFDFHAYPYRIAGPENSAFLISIHEPIIWRLHGMVQHIHISRFSDAQTTDIKEGNGISGMVKAHGFSSFERLDYYWRLKPLFISWKES
ncbi:hypothetical protein Tco_0542212 [Tanacetum coccineum]